MHRVNLLIFNPVATAFTNNTQFTSRLLRNKGAVAGLVIIALAILTAIFAYAIAPDNTANANRIIPEIANRKPGFSMTFLKVNKMMGQDDNNLLHTLIAGKTDHYTYIPITAWHIAGDSLHATHYVDDGVTEPVTYPMQKIAYHFSPEQNIDHQTFWLGTDKFGRDILSRLIIGTRVSLSVGLITVLISLTVGILLGALAGYFKGWIDDVIMWLINVIWSIPTLLLVFAVTLLLGKGFWQVFIAVGLTMWVNVARLVRGQVLAVRELEYIEATRALGYSHTRTIMLHILPNILGPVMVIAAGNFAGAIVIEAGLSFLGVGVQPPMPSWGLMIKENYNFIITNNPMLALEPGIAIMLLVLAFNLVGNGLRDALNVKG